MRSRGGGMDYVNDVFISYKRQDEWTGWVRGPFRKLLKAYLTQELGTEPRIFVDDAIPVGADQAMALGDNLARSKVMIGVFSADYFGSEWCLHELDLMAGRAIATNTVGPNQGIIIPALVQDGHRIPSPIDVLQRIDLGEWRRVGINETWPTYPGFSEGMKGLAEVVGKAVLGAPNFDVAWVTDCTTRFGAVFTGRVPPTHLVPKPWPAPIAPPKLGV